jgi:hypothetical protein
MLDPRRKLAIVTDASRGTAPTMNAAWWIDIASIQAASTSAS